MQKDLKARLVLKVVTALQRSRLYPLFRELNIPDRLRGNPIDPWPGDVESGRAICDGQWTFAGQSFRFDQHKGEPDWFCSSAWAGWVDELHSFSWLRDVRQVGGDSRKFARDTIVSWTRECSHSRRFARRCDIVGSRLTAWLMNAGFLLSGADDEFRDLFFGSLCEQTRNLAQMYDAGVDGPGRISASRGLIYAGLSIPEYEQRLTQGLLALKLQLEAQTLSDGGQVQRNPTILLNLLRDLVDIRLALIQFEQEVPEWLQFTIDRAAVMLRFFRHQDGTLALFNGSGEGNADLIEAVLTIGQSGGKSIRRALFSGYERLEVGNTLVLVDVGVPPESEWCATAHAAPLAFEFSAGRERIVVSMGPWNGPEEAWRHAARGTAAHSTVSVDDKNVIEFRANGTLGRSPRRVVVDRRENEGEITLDMSHDGYRTLGRIIHKRHLHLSSNGDTLYGEDVLEGPGGEKFSLRFHLHPDVQPAVMVDTDVVMLRLKSGAGWQLKVAGGVVEVCESVYLGDGTMRRTKQISVSGGLNGERTVVNWVFTRLAAGGRSRNRNARRSNISLVSTDRLTEEQVSQRAHADRV